MSGNRIVLVSLLSIALAATAGCGSGSDAEIAVLKAQIESLEQQIQTLQSAAGPGALEQEAKSAYASIQALITAGKTDEAKAKLASYGTKYAVTRTSRGLTTLSRELAVVGKDSPQDWAVEKWYQGQEKIDLASHNTTVVVFWETWCPHCRKEVPKLQQMYEGFRDDGLQLIGVTRLTRSSTDQAVQDFLAQVKVEYPMAKVNDSLAKYFSIAGIPAAAVVKDGKVIWRGHPVRISDRLLKDWLAS